MAQFGEEKMLDRRGFLKGSAMFAATAVGLGMTTPLFAQDSQKTAEEKKKEEEDKAKAEKAKADKAKEGEQAKKDQPKPDSTQTAAKQDPDKLYDKNGVEYRVCERCGGNMYLEEKTWTCEQCGLSYVE